MSKAEAFLYKIFGASWFTSVLGYVVMAGGIAQLVQESVATSGVPTNATGWVTLISGVGIRAAKQANVSNASAPLAVAQTVVTVPGAPMAVPPTPITHP